jgi:hypothetical protein
MCISHFSWLFDAQITPHALGSSLFEPNCYVDSEHDPVILAGASKNTWLST